MALLKVRLVGPKVRQGKVSIDDLRLIAEGLQTSLQRFAERRTGGTQSLRRGPRTKVSKALVSLFVTGIQRGSTVLEFEPALDQMDLTGQRVGLDLFPEWVQGARSLQDPTRVPPEAFDRGVVSGLHQIHPVLGRGVDRIEFEWDEPRHAVRAVFDAGAATRAETLLLRPAQNRQTVTGVILQADFHSPEVSFTVYATDGRSVRCSASEDDLGTILGGIMHMVRVSGEARVEPDTNAVLSLQADSVEIEGEGELSGFPVGAVSDFWSSPDLSALELRQNIAAYDPTAKPEWEPPTQEEWERYEQVIAARRRRSAPLP